MAYRLDSASNQHLLLNTAVLAGVPIWTHCWFCPSNVTAAGNLITLCNPTITHFHSMAVRGDLAGDPLQALSAAGGTTVMASTTTGYVVDVWQMADALFDVTTATDRTIYLNAGGVGTNTTNRAPVVENTAVGGNPDGSSAFSGIIADAAIFSVLPSLRILQDIYQRRWSVGQTIAAHGWLARYLQAYWCHGRDEVALAIDLGPRQLHAAPHNGARPVSGAPGLVYPFDPHRKIFVPRTTGVVRAA